MFRSRFSEMPTIYQESKFIGNARTPHQFALGIIPMGRQSSAYGYSQALDGTWEERSTRNRRAKRDDIDDATDFMGWYKAQNQYLAYHEGRTGYARGSYRAKAWPMRIAGEVGQRLVNFHAQLISCGKA